MLFYAGATCLQLLLMNALQELKSLRSFCAAVRLQQTLELAYFPLHVPPTNSCHSWDLGRALNSGPDTPSESEPCINFKEASALLKEGRGGGGEGGGMNVRKSFQLRTVPSVPPASQNKRRPDWVNPQPSLLNISGSPLHEIEFLLTFHANHPPGDKMGQPPRRFIFLGCLS